MHRVVVDLLDAFVIDEAEPGIEILLDAREGQVALQAFLVRRVDAKPVGAVVAPEALGIALLRPGRDGH